MYYTKSNEGRYRIVEETAAIGYYGDYQEDNKENKKNVWYKYNRNNRK